MLHVWTLSLMIWAFREGCVAWIPYNKSIGGTRLRKMPDPFMDVITVTDHWADYPQPDCVGVHVGGYGSIDTSFVLTSPWCIATPMPSDPYWIPQEVRNAVNEVTSSVPFNLSYSFDDNFRLGVLQVSLPVGYWVPDIADMILNKREFKRHLDPGNEPFPHGFSLGVSANPVKVFVVSWNQENCTRRYNESKLPGWPDQMREGWFCVFQGRLKVNNVAIGRHVYDIDVGRPCDDALGSPVLISDFNKVLGIIIKTFCDGDRSVAFAMSPAYLPVITPRTHPTTPSTIAPPSSGPPPPLPPPPPQPRVPAPFATCSATRIFHHLLLWSIVTSFDSLGG